MDEAQELCDRVALMTGGKVVVIDTPERLIQKYGGKTIILLRMNKPIALEMIVKVKEAIPDAQVRCVQSTMIVSVLQDLVAKAIVEVSRVAKETGYEIRSSVVKEPELEDVFLHITGTAIKA